MGNRYVCVLEESAYGTRKDPWTGQVFMPYLDCDLQPKQNVQKLTESLYLEDSGAIYGGFVGGGNLRTLARADNMGNYLKWLFGGYGKTSQAPGAMWRHRYTVDQSPKSFTLEHATEKTTKAMTYLGCVVKGLTLEAAQNSPGICTWDIQYRNEDKQYDKTNLGAIPAVRPFVLHDASVSVFTTPVKAESIRIAAERSVPDDAHTSESRLLPDISEEGFKISGELELRFESWDQREDFYGGTGTPTTPQEEVTLGNISVDFVGPPSGDATYTTFDLKIDLPSCTLMENPFRVSARDRLKQSVTFEAVRSATSYFDLYNLAPTY
jgi:hypothetical protein